MTLNSKIDDMLELAEDVMNELLENNVDRIEGTENGVPDIENNGEIMNVEANHDVNEV